MEWKNWQSRVLWLALPAAVAIGLLLLYLTRRPLPNQIKLPLGKGVVAIVVPQQKLSLKAWLLKTYTGRNLHYFNLWKEEATFYDLTIREAVGKSNFHCFSIYSSGQQRNLIHHFVRQHPDRSSDSLAGSILVKGARLAESRPYQNLLIEKWTVGDNYVFILENNGITSLSSSETSLEDFAVTRSSIALDLQLPQGTWAGVHVARKLLGGLQASLPVLYQPPTSWLHESSIFPYIKLLLKESNQQLLQFDGRLVKQNDSYAWPKIESTSEANKEKSMQIDDGWRYRINLKEDVQWANIVERWLGKPLKGQLHDVAFISSKQLDARNGALTFTYEAGMGEQLKPVTLPGAVAVSNYRGRTIWATDSLSVLARLLQSQRTYYYQAGNSVFISGDTASLVSVTRQFVPMFQNLDVAFQVSLDEIADTVRARKGAWGNMLQEFPLTLGRIDKIRFTQSGLNITGNATLRTSSPLEGNLKLGDVAFENIFQHQLTTLQRVKGSNDYMFTQTSGGQLFIFEPGSRAIVRTKAPGSLANIFYCRYQNHNAFAWQNGNQLLIETASLKRSFQIAAGLRLHHVVNNGTSTPAALFNSDVTGEWWMGYKPKKAKAFRFKKITIAQWDRNCQTSTFDFAGRVALCPEEGGIDYVSIDDSVVVVKHLVQDSVRYNHLLQLPENAAPDAYLWALSSQGMLKTFTGRDEMLNQKFFYRPDAITQFNLHLAGRLPFITRNTTTHTALYDYTLDKVLEIPTAPFTPTWPFYTDHSNKGLMVKSESGFTFYNILGKPLLAEPIASSFPPIIAQQKGKMWIGIANNKVVEWKPVN